MLKMGHRYPLIRILILICIVHFSLIVFNCSKNVSSAVRKIAWFDLWLFFPFCLYQFLCIVSLIGTGHSHWLHGLCHIFIMAVLICSYFIAEKWKHCAETRGCWPTLYMRARVCAALCCNHHTTFVYSQYNVISIVCGCRHHSHNTNVVAYTFWLSHTPNKTYKYDFECFLLHPQCHIWKRKRPATIIVPHCFQSVFLILNWIDYSIRAMENEWKNNA